MKVNLNKVNTVFFLGIGGIGMSALTRYFMLEGKTVWGYDRHYSKMTNDLEEEGARIIYKEDPYLIEIEIDLVIRTPAVPVDSPLINYFKDKGITIKKRAEILGEITRDSNTRSIGIAGTHGKTTISTILAHILTHAGKHCNAFLGGISANYNTNFIHDPHAKYTVIEADEFDRSFHQLNPYMALVSSTDADHLDIYNTPNELLEAYSKYLSNTESSGAIFLKKGLSLDVPQHLKTYTYSIEEAADYFASNIHYFNGKTYFNLNFEKQRIEEIEFSFPGKHNVENATGASAISIQLGVTHGQLREALRSFKGIYRRFNIHIHNSEFAFIDDYAHHPQELTAVINSTKDMFQGKKITGIFQPHLFSRTRDFADEFARALSLLDELWLLDIYPAREKPIQGIDSQWLLDKVVIKNKKLVKKEDLTGEALFKNKNLQVLMTLGAGDIGELVTPMANTLAKVYNK